MQYFDQEEPGHEIIEELRELLKPSKDAVALVHPEMPLLGILWIPEEFVLKTAGAQKYSKSQPHIPSLCLLFQHSRCNSREACNQIHVEREFAERLRHLLNTSNISNCCRYHGDLGSSNSKLMSGNERLEIRANGVAPIPVPANRIAVTEYWSAAFSWNYLRDRQNTLFFAPSRVCNLHQRQSCKYGSACKNVHICREFWMQVTRPFARAENDMVNFQQKFGNLHQQAPPSSDGHLATANILAKIPGQKRVSRALPIVDPTSGEEIRVKAQAQADASTKAGPSDVESFSHKADDPKGAADDPLCLSIEHLDLMAMALNLDGFQNIFPLPLDLEAELPGLPEVVPASKPTAAQGKFTGPLDSPPNLSFNGPPLRPGSPSNSSGTDVSFGDDGSEDDGQKRGVKANVVGNAYSAFWGPVSATTSVATHLAPGPAL